MSLFLGNQPLTGCCALATHMANLQASLQYSTWAGSWIVVLAGSIVVSKNKFRFIWISQCRVQLTFQNGPLNVERSRIWFDLTGVCVTLVIIVNSYWHKWRNSCGQDWWHHAITRNHCFRSTMGISYILYRSWLILVKDNDNSGFPLGSWRFEATSIATPGHGHTFLHCLVKEQVWDKFHTNRHSSPACGKHCLWFCVWYSNAFFPPRVKFERLTNIN